MLVREANSFLLEQTHFQKGAWCAETIHSPARRESLIFLYFAFVCIAKVSHIKTYISLSYLSYYIFMRVYETNNK